MTDCEKINWEAHGLKPTKAPVEQGKFHYRVWVGEK